MKKVLLIAAIMAFFGGVYAIAGDSRSVPVSDVSQSIVADYAGVDYWGTNFSAAVSTVALPSAGNSPSGTYGIIASTTLPSFKNWTVYGAYFSSGSCTSADYIEMFVSTGGFASVDATKTMRFYNIFGSTAAANAGAVCSGVSNMTWPIHAKGNVFIRPSVATYNQTGLLYYREPD